MSYLPPVGFHFMVHVRLPPPPKDPASTASGDSEEQNDFDLRFSEVQGLSVEAVMEEYAEGGENSFVQKYPVRTKYPDLVLKRGLLRNSRVAKWVLAALQEFVIEPVPVTVTLLAPDLGSGDKAQPLMTWNLVGAYPTKWSVSDLNASSNTFVIESLQLYYQRFTVQYPTFAGRSEPAEGGVRAADRG